MGQCHRALQSQGTPVAWLTVDQDDNDPERFVFDLQSALAPVFSKPPPGEAGGRAHRLLDELAAFQGGFVLLVDDLERLDSPEVLQTFARVIDALGPNQRVVIGSRSMPSLALGRLRAQGALLEIDRKSLRFSMEDLRDYLAARLAARVDEANLTLLQSQTDGWPVAVQLAASLIGPAGADAALRTPDFSRAMASYLAEDVLARLPAHELHFLFQTALFESFCAAMCDTVLERQDSTALLQKIERENILLFAVESEGGGWFEYHPLFLAFLRSRPGVPAGEDAKGMHVKAATWLAHEGRLTQAIHHALAGGASEVAAEWMSLCALEMINTGQIDILRNWVDATPEHLLERHPELALSGAYAMAIRHRHTAAIRLIDLVERAAPLDPQVASEVVGARLAAFSWGDEVPKATALARAHVSGLDDAPPRVRGLVLNVAAYECISRGNYAQALHHLATAKRAYGGEIHGINHTLCFEGAIELHQGNVAEARLRFEATLRRIIDAGYRFTDASGVAAAHLAEALYEQNDLQAVELLLEDYLPTIRDACTADHVIVAYRVAARTHALRGRLRSAQQTLSELLDLGDAWAIPRIAAAARHERLRLALLGGDLASARHLMALMEQSVSWKADADQFLHADDLDDGFIASVRLSMRSGAAPSMIPRVQEAVAKAEAAHHTRRAVRLRCLLAQACEAALKRPQALEVLEQALRVASTKGLIRVVADEPWHLQPLLDAIATRDGIHPPHLAAVCDAMQPMLTPVLAASEPSAGEALLSDRERQVLRLLADGLSNKQLSRDLFISENTVESHLRRINGKLGVRNRMQAVTRARELGLV